MDLTIALIILMIVLGGIFVVAYSLTARHRLRELVLRERIAMIEKGLAPPPEIDPLQFERTLLAMRGLNRPPSARAVRHRTGGITLIGLGLGLFVLIGFAADAPGTGFGIGGALAVLGAAFVVNGYLTARDAPEPPPPPEPPPSGEPPKA